MEDPFLGEIDESRLKNPKVQFPTFFIIVSIVVIVIGILVARSNSDFIKNAEITKANLYYKKVVAMSKDENTNYEVYAKYSINGKEYYEHLKDIGVSGLALIGIRDGKEAKIYYNPDNPREIKDNSSKHTGTIIIAFGTLLFTLLTTDYLISVKKSKKNSINMNQLNNNDMK